MFCGLDIWWVSSEVLLRRENGQENVVQHGRAQAKDRRKRQTVAGGSAFLDSSVATAGCRLAASGLYAAASVPIDNHKTQQHEHQQL